MINKKLLIFGSIFAIALVSAVAVYFASVNTTITVNEAFTTSEIPLTLDGAYPDGVERCVDVSIRNDASVPLNAEIIWFEDTNGNVVLYETDADIARTDSIGTGEQLIPVCFTVETGSPVGEITGHITIERVA